MSTAGIRSSRGDIYQLCVAMDWAIRMIKDDSIAWIELDSTRTITGGIPAPVDDVIVGWTSGMETCCQCKKNEPAFTTWKVREIEDDLKKAAEHLVADPNALVRFYARADWGSLASMVARAQITPDLAAFRAGFPKKDDDEQSKLETAWSGALANGSQDVHSLLRRMAFELTRALGDFEAHLKLDLGQIVTHVDIAWDALWSKLDKLGARATDSSTIASSDRITREELLELLYDKGCAVTPPRVQAEVEAKLRAMSKIGREWRRDIAGKRVERKAFAELVAASATDGSVLLTDGPGSGKTCVLLQLMDELEPRADIRTLFLQARDFADAGDQEARAALGLEPDIPVLVSSMSQWKRVVVVIDSLDVLSLSRESKALTFFLSLIDRLRTIPNICIVVACRSFDLQYNSRLAARTWGRKIEAGLLCWDAAVEPLLRELGVDTAAVDQTTRELLGNPRNLALFADIAAKSTRRNLSSAQELTDMYLDVAVVGDPELGTPAMVVIERMAQEMLKERRHQLPRSRVTDDDALRLRLCSANVLFESDRGELGFGHQTLLDALAVRNAVRQGMGLLEFINSLQPVPFIRPAIRAFFTHLRLSDRSKFSGQVRAVFDSKVAFHIKRLIAESMAACEPDQNDWGLLRHLFRKHQEHFALIYDGGHSLSWHRVWMNNLVPLLEELGDGRWLAIHFRRLQAWANDDPEGVFAFWTKFASSSYAKDANLRTQFGFVVRGFTHLDKVDAQPLLEALLKLPSVGHDMLGGILLRWARQDRRGDALLWRYITEDVPLDPTRDREIDERLRFDESSFQHAEDLIQRFAASDWLLETAVATLERWSNTLALGPRAGPGEVAEGPNDELRDETSHSVTHSQHSLRHISGLARLVQAIEAAILHRAKLNDAWWQANALRICLSDCGGLRYIGTLAMTESPTANAEAAKQFFADERRARLADRYELGRLISATAPFLGDAMQLVERQIFHRHSEHEVDAKAWVEAQRFSLLSRIPVLERSEAVKAAIARMSIELAPPDEEPDIYSRSGYVSAPYDADQLRTLSDDALVRLLIDAQSLGEGPRSFRGFSGGTEAVNRLIHSMASESPRRFLKLLESRRADLPEKIRFAMLGGAAHYMLHRYGHVQSTAWTAKEDVKCEELLELLLTELERQHAVWAGTREGATALAVCAPQVSTDTDVARVGFLSPAYITAADPAIDERIDDDLISVAINSSRGELAEGLMQLASTLIDANRDLPPLLAPSLKRLAQDGHPAVRAVVLRQLGGMHEKSELGWELFDAAFTVDDQRLWKFAAYSLQFATGKQFARAQTYLDRMEHAAEPGMLKYWGRLSALAMLDGHTAPEVLLEKLARLNDESAWDGAISVWVSNAGSGQFAAICFAGLDAAVKHPAAHAALLHRMDRLFQPQKPAPRVPLPLFRAVYVDGGVGTKPGSILAPRMDEWLSRFAEADPEQALELAEIVARICKERDSMPFYDPQPLGMLLTTLFREAEELEASDGGAMLGRVVALQDAFLASPTQILGEWLRAAERPDT